LDKIAKFSTLGGRAGFNPGANGRAMQSCLDTIKKEWPHLQWWRAIRDDGTIEKGSSQQAELAAWGATFSDETDSGRVCVMVDEARLMVWDGAANTAKSAVKS
jgi:hypothetical protein